MRDEPQREEISIVDAIVAGQGEGPLAPEPLETGAMFAVRNPVESAILGARLLGFDERRSRCCDTPATTCAGGSAKRRRRFRRSPAVSGGARRPRDGLDISKPIGRPYGNARTKKQRVLVVLGTRPEAIKLAPVVLELQAAAGNSECVVWRPRRSTGRCWRPCWSSSVWRPRTIWTSCGRTSAGRSDRAGPGGPGSGAGSRAARLGRRPRRHDHGDGGGPGRLLPENPRGARGGRTPDERQVFAVSRGDQPADGRRAGRSAFRSDGSGRRAICARKAFRRGPFSGPATR
jgi:hypothetical protein